MQLFYAPFILYMHHITVCLLTTTMLYSYIYTVEIASYIIMHTIAVATRLATQGVHYSEFFILQEQNLSPSNYIASTWKK